jgi:hypothetical protein
MRKFIFIFVSSFSLLSCDWHEYLPGPITEGKMVEALQEALVFGSKTAASNLGDSSCSLADAERMGCLKGYLGNKLVEIALPDTVKDVLNRVNSFTNSINNLSPEVHQILSSLMGSAYSSILSLGQYGDSIKTALNRGAEQAAPKSIDVFKNAIFSMSFSDARGLLMGDSVAATTYLNITTYSELQTAFAPIIKEPLDLLNPNKYWTSLASTYNSFAGQYSSIKSLLGSNALSLPYDALPQDISQALSEYAVGKALDGLFLMVGKQETQLRADPWGTVKAAGGFITDSVGDLLGDVFGKAKNNSL